MTYVLSLSWSGGGEQDKLRCCPWFITSAWLKCGKDTIKDKIFFFWKVLSYCCCDFALLFNQEYWTCFTSQRSNVDYLTGKLDIKIKDGYGCWRLRFWALSLNVKKSTTIVVYLFILNHSSWGLLSFQPQKKKTKSWGFYHLLKNKPHLDCHIWIS